MYRLHLRLIQRAIIIATSVSLFGSISVWLSLFTGLEIQPHGDLYSERETHDLLANIRLGDEAEGDTLHRSKYNLPLKGQKRLSRHSSIVKRVFDINPAPIQDRHAADQNDKHEIISLGMNLHESDNDKYMFVFHHYEQFGKTTENFVQLCAISAYGSRHVVEPFVRHSRMCGLRTGWWGEALTPSRLFKPLSLYFDVKAMNGILSQNRYATVRPLAEFKKMCNKTISNLTIVHFVYKDGREATKKWFKLSESDYEGMFSRINRNGWTDCPFIDKGLNISTRLGGTQPGRQLCVNAEKVIDHKQFENDILKGDKCVVITYWKGFGIARTHFKPNTTTLNPREIVHKLRHSDLILQEVELYRRTYLEKTFIALHVRSERQLLWYSETSFLRCVDIAIRIVLKMKQKYGINTVFLATDLTQHGSDTLLSNNKKRLSGFQKLLMDKLKPKRYSPHQTDRSLMDHGVVAIVEMNILSHSKHLVTLGSGSFQEWVIALFKDKKKGKDQFDWTISKVCSREKKVH